MTFEIPKLTPRQILGREVDDKSARAILTELGFEEAHPDTFFDENRAYRLRQMERMPQMPFRQTHEIPNLLVPFYAKPLYGLQTLQRYANRKFFVRPEDDMIRVWCY